MVWNGKQFFSVKVTKNAMSAFIPKGTAILPEVMQIDYHTFLDFLVAQHGVLLPPSQAVFEDLKAALKHNPYGFKQNFELVAGEQPLEGKPGKLDLLRNPGVPPDMCIEGVPYMQYVKPVEPEDGMNVRNEVIPAPKLIDPLRELILPEELEMDEKGRVIPLASGQVELKDSTLIYRPLYKVADPSEPSLQGIEFPCSVWIEGDLPSTVQWRIKGNLVVDGHLSTGNLEIFGDLTVKLGIQTNNEGTLRVYGDTKTGYLQMTRIAVKGDLTVERGILQCEVRVAGNLRCMGIPGAIQGSKIFCLASIQANRAGSDAGIETVLEMPYLNQSRPIKIASVSQGTKIIFKDKAWTAAGKSAFSAQADQAS